MFAHGVGVAGAPLVLIGNPDTNKRRLDSTIAMPHFLSFLTSHNWNERLTGLDQIPTRNWPSSVPLVYYAYHIMVGLGTILLLIAALGVFLLWRGRLFESRGMLWALMLTFPFTYIANIAGWVTAETGRQPWTVFGLERTADAFPRIQASRLDRACRRSLVGAVAHAALITSSH